MRFLLFILCLTFAHSVIAQHPTLRCWSDYDCSSSEICIGGQCLRTDGPLKLSGLSFLNFSRECKYTKYCKSQLKCFDGKKWNCELVTRCRPPTPCDDNSGSPFCNWNSECGFNEVCINGICRSKDDPFENRCTSDADCGGPLETGSCDTFNGRCR